MEHSVKHAMCAGLLAITARLKCQPIFTMPVIFGFGALLAQVPIPYFAIKTVGAPCLIDIGVKMLVNMRTNSALDV
jgi:threonine/homoserine/homoserine lactone efflux protein